MVFKLARSLIKTILENHYIFGKQVKPRKTPPPKIKKWINKYKNNYVEDILVCREPINKHIKSFMNIITLGKFDKSLKGLRYEDLFHLYIYFKVKGVYYRIEKNAVITLSVSKKKKSDICLDLKEKKIKLGDFMKTAENYQKDFYSYNAKNNNCQDFVVSLLVGNKIIRKNSKTYKFIKQDAEEIFRRNPKYLEKFAVTITDIAGVFDIIKSGFE